MNIDNDGWEGTSRNDDPDNEVAFARLRQPDRTYVSKSFPLSHPADSPDYGQPTRYIHKVFDPVSYDESTCVHEEWTTAGSPGGRVQLKIQVVRRAGVVRKLYLHKVPANADATRLQTLLELRREGAAKLIELFRALDHVPVDGANTVRLDDDVIRGLFSDPDTVTSLYQHDRKAFRHAIQEDATARDLIALAYRREQLERFRRLLSDPDVFATERALCAGSAERVWQRFLEQNSWILGVSLAGQLFTAWDPAKLEQTVVGHSVVGTGKRIDALMQTAGAVRSMVFVEIKHHDTPLLAATAEPYRPGCWSPSRELSGGVVQVQQTAYRAAQLIKDRLAETDDSGADTGDYTYLIRPRSFLIIGDLNQLTNATGHLHQDKHRSFELFRRSLQEPEVLTFDELLARAEWHVDAAEHE